MKRRGMTLVELLITMVLLSALTTSMMWLLSIAKSQWQQGVSRAALRQELQTVLGRLDSDLTNSEAELMTDNTTGTPVAFSYPMALDARGNFVTDDFGGVAWQKWVVYYIPVGTTKLLRRDVSVTFPDPAEPLTTPELVAYCDGTGSVVSRNMVSLTLDADPDSATAVVGLTLAAKSADGKTDQVNATLTVLTRN